VGLEEGGVEGGGLLEFSVKGERVQGAEVERRREKISEGEAGSQGERRT